MALNIKDPETDRLARELAARMNTTITEALKIALSERLRRMPAPDDSVYVDLLAIGGRGRARALKDIRPVEEILGYDEHGLPA